MNGNYNDHRHRRHVQTRGTEPVYLSRAQRIWLANALGGYVEGLRASADAPPAFVRDEIKMVGSIRARLREARIDG